MKLGKFLNKYIKSYGCDWFEIKYGRGLWNTLKGDGCYCYRFWPRRWLVRYLVRIIGQIEEKEYLKARNTLWK